MQVVSLSKLQTIKTPITKAQPSFTASLHNLYQLIEDASFIGVPLFAYLAVSRRIDTNHLNQGAKWAVSLGCAALFIKFLRYLSAKGV
jgi:hypothetical protein